MDWVIKNLYQVLHQAIMMKVDGKDLGSALEFKSEIKLSFEIFENSK